MPTMQNVKSATFPAGSPTMILLCSLIPPLLFLLHNLYSCFMWDDVKFISLGESCPGRGGGRGNLFPVCCHNERVEIPLLLSRSHSTWALNNNSIRQTAAGAVVASMLLLHCCCLNSSQMIGAGGQMRPTLQRYSIVCLIHLFHGLDVKEKMQDKV